MVEKIIDKIKKIKNLDWDESKKNNLDKYFRLLESENLIHNLTRIVKEDDVWLKHFYDSLIICEEVNFNNLKICDIGTGPGIPGLVLKICFPNLKITLIESNNKKVSFLKKVVKELNLEDVKIIEERAEKYSVKHSEEQDLIISRATAPLNILLEIGVQNLKVGGLFVALKSLKLDEEIIELNNCEKEIGLNFVKVQEIFDEDLGTRKNIIYKKVCKTNKKFPREYKQIKNSPLGK